MCGSRPDRNVRPTSAASGTASLAHISQKLPRMPGKGGVRRRWHLDLHGIRREGTKESGFSYRMADGTPVKDEKIVARIAKLRIPPAWRDVRIARSDAAPLQAVGVDKKGRVQYRYHNRFRAQRDEEKFKRV